MLVLEACGGFTGYCGCITVSHPKKTSVLVPLQASCDFVGSPKAPFLIALRSEGMLLTSGPHPALPQVNAAPSELAMEKTSLPLSSGAAKNKQREYLLLGIESGGILLNVLPEHRGCERSFGQGQREEKCTQGRERCSSGLIGLVERCCR